MAHSKVFSASELQGIVPEDRQEPSGVLLVSPDFFEIIDVKNPYMQGQEGNTDDVGARVQWEVLKKQYENLVKENTLDEVIVLPGVKGCEDMVFAANQSFPWISETGKKQVILSKMRHKSRQQEIRYFEDFYRSRGYEIFHLQKTNMFEGMGDAIPMPGKRLIFGGYGYRTGKEAYEEISELLNVPVIPLELKDQKFYHLDTCFVPLSEDTVLIYPHAFSDASLSVIHKIFRSIITVPLLEATNFALNVHVINMPGKQKTAFIQEGNPCTSKALEGEGYKVTEVKTGEYIKSGGSVFCMKMMIY